MKYLFAPASVFDQASLETVKTLLENEGIPSVIRNEHLSMAIGEIPFTEAIPEIWVLNDEDHSRAHEMVEVWRNLPAETGDEWLCPECGETIEAQFTSCWNCGGQR